MVLEAPVRQAVGHTARTRWFVLLGAILIQVILGTVYGYSIFWEPLQARVYPPIASAAEQAAAAAGGQETAGWQIVASAEEAARLRATQQGYLKYAFAVCILSFALTMVVAGRVQDARGPRFTALIGAVLMGAGFLVAGLLSHPVVFYLAHAALVGVGTLAALMLFDALAGPTESHVGSALRHVPPAILVGAIVAGVVIGQEYVGHEAIRDRLFLLWGTVGLLAGAGIGFAYVCPIAALIKWFPAHKGLVSGIAVAGFGFGAFLFSRKDAWFGALGFIQERGIETFFLAHAAVCFAVVTLGALLLKNPPSLPAARGGEESPGRVLRRPAFYLLWLMFFSGALAGLMVIGVVKVFAGEQLVGAAGGELDAAARQALMLKGAAAVGWLAIFNALGRIAWGLVSDRIGRTPTFVVMFGCQAVVMFLLGQMSRETSLAVGAALVGFNFGGCFALFPSATADFFGARNLGANYGWLFTSYGIAGVVGIAAGNAAKAATGSYASAFALAGALCVFSAGLAGVLHWLRRREARE